MTFDELEKLANEATPGPWHATTVADKRLSVDIQSDRAGYWAVANIPIGVHDFDGERNTNCRPRKDAAFIAAHNPERMQRIYKLLREAREALTYYARWQSPDAGERADDVLAKLEDL